MGCADFCLDMGYDGGGEFHRSAMQRARKAHRCCECGDEIKVGEKYQYASGKYEGEFFDQRTCAACAEIRSTFCCGGWIYEQLWESMGEEVFPRWTDGMFGTECLAKLKTKRAVTKMRERYEDWRGDDEESTAFVAQRRSSGDSR